MTSSPYFVSLHPSIALDENLSLFADLSHPSVQLLLTHAMGVLMPTHVTPQRYFKIIQLASAWFPRLEVRFQYLGKTRQIQLFRELGIRHPESPTWLRTSRGVFPRESRQIVPGSRC